MPLFKIEKNLQFGKPSNMMIRRLQHSIVGDCLVYFRCLCSLLVCKYIFTSIGQDTYNQECLAQDYFLDPIIDPLRWCQESWQHGHNPAPSLVKDLWSVSLNDYRVLATKLVYTWGLVRVYNHTKQGNYMCPLPPHCLEAFNHKVNYDTHPNLLLQDQTVIQYMRTLWSMQVISQTVIMNGMWS